MVDSVKKSWRKCDKGHQLSREPDLKKWAKTTTSSYNENRFNCNGCSIVKPNTTKGLLRCSDCSYDFCPECETKCLKGHPLGREPDLKKWAKTPTSSYNENRFNCDGCRIVQPNTTKGLLGCRICSLDICPSCDV